MPTGILTFPPISRIFLLPPLLACLCSPAEAGAKRRCRHEQRRSFRRGSQAPAKRFVVRGDRLFGNIALDWNQVTAMKKIGKGRDEGIPV
jgi:hypothetical protein